MMLKTIDDYISETVAMSLYDIQQNGQRQPSCQPLVDETYEYTQKLKLPMQWTLKSKLPEVKHLFKIILSTQ